jgi:hypothetical protein
MPLRIVGAADRGIRGALEDLEDPGSLLPLGFLLFNLDQAFLGVGRPLLGHPLRVPSRLSI